MKSLHKIRPALPETILSQIWAQRKNLAYNRFIYARIDMKKLEETIMYKRTVSPLMCSPYSDFSDYYAWWWEWNRVDQYIAAGRPPIDMSTVELIYENIT